MISLKLFIVLALGALVICVPIAIQMKWYRLAIWKSIMVSIAIIIAGFFGAEMLFFIENGYFGGKSFFGAIFLSPVVFLFVSKLLHIPYALSLDFCATGGCLILAILKIQCLADGCCEGIILYLNEQHMYVRFPSQMIEFIVATILFAILFVLSYYKKYRERIFPLTLVLYGSTRFVLNFFRDDWERAQEMNLPMPIGNIWSIVAIVIGAIWLIVVYRKRKKSQLFVQK